MVIAGRDQYVSYTDTQKSPWVMHLSRLSQKVCVCVGGGGGKVRGGDFDTFCQKIPTPGGQRIKITNTGTKKSHKYIYKHTENY